MKIILVIITATLTAACSTERAPCRGLQPINKPAAVVTVPKKRVTGTHP